MSKSIEQQYDILRERFQRLQREYDEIKRVAEERRRVLEEQGGMAEVIVEGLVEWEIPKGALS